MKLSLKYVLSLMVGVCCSLNILAEDEPKVGQLAPNFNLVQLDGSQFQLSDYRNKQAVYLVFWNTWCSYCMKKIPTLQDAQANLKDQLRIIAINTSLDDSVEEALLFQNQFDIKYPLAFDHGRQVTDLYGVWGTPTEFIIDINGIIQHRDQVPDELRQYLAQWNTPLNHKAVMQTDSVNCIEEESAC